jgi:hypothetical protein
MQTNARVSEERFRTQESAFSDEFVSLAHVHCTDAAVSGAANENH